ncbi:MAG: hypothetical protein STSR0004_12050 [Peptococcaceae bacterium]
MDKNKLWESHRLILPEMREKTIKRCGNCQFFVPIQGKEEIRYGCVVSLPVYGTLQKRTPKVMHVIEILRMAGREGLDKIMENGDAQAQACGLFRPGTKK